MADQVEGAKGRARHDGRFGKHFDDEVSVKGVLWTTAMLALSCVLGMWITWEMLGIGDARAEASKQQQSPIPGANEPRTPPGPVLQKDPEGELETLKHEMSERLGGYGWINEGAGVVHIPIDRAIDLLVSQAEASSDTSLEEPAPQEPAPQEPTAEETGE